MYAGRVVRGTEILHKPRTGGSVWPGERCPAFVSRTTGLGRGRNLLLAQNTDGLTLDNVSYIRIGYSIKFSQIEWQTEGDS